MGIRHLVIMKVKKEALSYILSYIKGNLNSTSCKELIQALKRDSEMRYTLMQF
jgi:hypothetical protein